MLTPKSFLDINIYNREYTSQLISNSEFDANITGWTNGDADDSSNTFTTLSWTDDPSLGGVLDATYGGSATSGIYNFHTTSTFTIDVTTGSAPIVTVTYSIIRNSETPSGLSAPKVQMRLYNSTNGYVTTNEGQRTLSIYQNAYTFTDTFSATTIQGLTVGANYLDVQIEITDATTTGSEFYFNYIRVNQASSNEPTDYIIKNEVALTKQYPGKQTVHFYIADQRESSNDIFSIKDSGGNYTTGWARYGKTEIRNLTYCFALEWAKSNYKPAEYVRTNVYDKDEIITPISLLSDTTHSATKYYRPIGYEVDYRSGLVSLQMKDESLVIDSDQSVYADAYKKDTNYGE
jgi:hypothetical protein